MFIVSAFRWESQPPPESEWKWWNTIKSQMSRSRVESRNDFGRQSIGINWNIFLNFHSSHTIDRVNWLIKFSTLNSLRVPTSDDDEAARMSSLLRRVEREIPLEMLIGSKCQRWAAVIASQPIDRALPTPGRDYAKPTGLRIVSPLNFMACPSVRKERLF